MLFSCLPAEIYAAFIDQLDELDVRPTLLALTRAIPRSPVPRYQLFRRIRIQADQSDLSKLYQRIRPQAQGLNIGDEPRIWVQELYLETWTADAETVLHILNLLPNLTTLTLWIGPKNLAPEHLEELFSIDRGGRCLKCAGSLRSLSLRFKPYVQKANYQQFLSGLYFDSLLEALSRWPRGRLSTLSIVQDPLTNETATSEGSEVSPPQTFSLGLPQRTLAMGFAQPIVFFQLESTFPSLLRGPLLRMSLHTLQLRFPSRNITRSLTQTPVPHPPSYGASIPAGSVPSRKYHLQPANGHLSPTPHLKFLDLSTCLIPENSLPHILHHYPSLTHLVLDNCNILRNNDIAIRDNAREWGSVSMSCAIAGISKAREREKIINAWLDTFGAEKELGKDKSVKSSQMRNRARTQGRKGLASATLSLRKGDTPSGGGSSSSKTDTSTPERVRILPPLPTLRHVTTTLYVPASMIPPNADMPPPDILQPLLMNVQREWERGWAEGLVQLMKVRERIHTSWRNKLVRVVRFASPEELGSNKLDTSAKSSTTAGFFLPFPPSTTVGRRSQSEVSSDGESEDPFQDLIELVDSSDFDHNFGVSSLGIIRKTPVLCLAGTPMATKSEQGISNLVGGERGVVAIQGLDHTMGCAHKTEENFWLNT
ncbi:hypothetical protein C8R42DRAFT_668930 [Lentinula raphanica]|nr:hypothetical protein C8R42DRAFT_668930 [Lentinula raphanica]